MPEPGRREADGAALRRAAARVEKDLAATRNGTTLGAAASLSLLLGNPPRALALIDEALARAGDDQRLLLDRAAAVLAMDAAADRSADIAYMADRLAAMQPGYREARGTWFFDLGLLLDRMGLQSEAEVTFRQAARVGDDWAAESARRAVALEVAASTPGWQSGDRQRLLAASAEGDVTLVRSLVERWPMAASVLVEDELLAPLGGDRDRARHQADLIAAVLAERGDTFLRDSLRTAKGRGSVDPYAAYGQYAEARRLQREGRCEAAQVLFDRAGTTLRRHASPFAALADWRWASCAHQQGQFSEAIARLRASLARLPSMHHDMRGRLEWLWGLHALELGDPATALAHYRMAGDLFRRGRLDEGVATAEMLMAETWWQLGESTEAWRHRRQAMERLPAVADAQRQRTILDEAAEAAAGDGLSALASLLQDRVVSSAREAENDFALPMALTQRGRVRIRRGDPAGAADDLRKARQGVAAMPATPLRKSLDAHLLLVEAEALERTNPAASIEKLAAASVHYQEMERWEPLRSAALRAARCQLRLARREAALHELQRATAISERIRQHGSDGVRGALDTQAQPVFDELVRLELAAGHVDEAFRYSELARARRLVEAAGGSQVSLPQLQKLLPENTALLAYHNLDDRLVVFVIRRSQVWVEALEAGGLGADVAALRGSLQHAGHPIDWKAASSALQSRLFASLLHRLDGVSSLVIVPHRELMMVPFAALQDTAGRFVVETYRLQVAPSASLFAAALRRQRLGARLTPRVVVAGAARPSAGLAAVLPVLPHADDEAKSVAALYDGAEVLAGAQATRSRFLSQARVSEVVHFAGHAVASASDPGQSFLVMASDADGRDVLYAREIDRETWPATRLVVLSACRTAQSSPRDAEGIQGLARAFLSAGVPAVVAALWNVDDRLAERIAVAFHQAHARGLDPASALRAAQLSVLHEDHDEAPTWAAFEMIGGVVKTPIH